MINVLLFLLFSQVALAQNSHDEIIQRFIEQRKQMMEEMMKAFGDDEFFSDSFDDDKMFDTLRKNGIGGFGAFESKGQNVIVKEEVQDDGSINVVITPQNENVNLNIETKNNRISIKSETRVEQKNEYEENSSQIFSSSSMTRSISIPDGFKAKEPKQVDKSIVITLVPNEKSKIKIIDSPNDSKDKKVPLQRRSGEKVI